MNDCILLQIHFRSTLSKNYRNRLSLAAEVLNIGFYLAMHFSAKRGIATACRLAVCDVGGL